MRVYQFRHVGTAFNYRFRDDLRKNKIIAYKPEKSNSFFHQSE